MKNLVCVGILFFFCLARGQYHFSGNVSEENIGTSIYLSMVEDYRKSSRTYLDQIIKKVNVDSTGFFQFQGDNLPESNGIYRIHLDPCDADSSDMHFLGNCGNSPNVLFIASNKDTVQFPTSFEDQALCTINSTNPKSQLLLEIEGFKEEMIFDFTEYRSETNQKLNLEKWFATLQKHGETATEPLVELYIYDFLSVKKNETYGYYLQDLLQNPYYDMLLNRLEADGGGDTPEDLQSALDEAMNALQWRDSAVRIGFIVADAVPHTDYGQTYSYRKAIKDALERGAKWVAGGAGGLPRRGEVILRQSAQ